MTTSNKKFSDLLSREKDLNFWNYLIPHLKPFNDSRFKQNHLLAKTSQKDLNLNDSKTLQIKQGDKILNSKLSCSSLKMKMKSIYRLEKKKNGQYHMKNEYCGSEQPFSDRKVLPPENKTFLTKQNLQLRLKLGTDHDQGNCNKPNTRPCYVRLEKLNSLEMSNNDARVSVPRKDKCDSKLVFLVGSEVPKDQVREENHINKLEMEPRIVLGKVEDCVNFMNNFNLKPTWKNRVLFKSPERPEKLGKFRRKV